MPLLKVYEWERTIWPEFRKVSMTLKQADAVIKKLSRHFKLSCPKVTDGCNGTHWNGKYSPNTGENFLALIRLRTINNLGTVCHEFAHHLDYNVYGGLGHRRTFKRALKKVYTWAKRYLPSTFDREAAVLMPAPPYYQPPQYQEVTNG